MASSEARIFDAFQIAMQRARTLPSNMGITGYGVIELWGDNGELKLARPFANLITTAGDQYYAKKGIVAIGPANPSAPTAANGMKLGTGSTAVAKSGAGAAIVTYTSGSNIAFDASYAQANAVAGTDTGWTADYKTTWGAGVATATISEATIVNDQATNSGASAANTYSRVTFTGVVKGASDTLAITWLHKFLGA